MLPLAVGRLLPVATLVLRRALLFAPRLFGCALPLAFRLLLAIGPIALAFGLLADALLRAVALSLSALLALRALLLAFGLTLRTLDGLLAIVPPFGALLAALLLTLLAIALRNLLLAIVAPRNPLLPLCLAALLGTRHCPLALDLRALPDQAILPDILAFGDAFQPRAAAIEATLTPDVEALRFGAAQFTFVAPIILLSAGDAAVVVLPLRLALAALFPSAALIVQRPPPLVPARGEHRAPVPLA